jgi:hypothetical protein
VKIGTGTIVLFFSCAVAGCAASQARSIAAPVAFSAVGDDLLSVRFREILVKKLQSAGRYIMVEGKYISVETVFVSRNIEPIQIENRTRASYRVEISSSTGGEVSVVKGWCWSDQLGICAGRIVRELDMRI